MPSLRQDGSWPSKGVEVDHKQIQMTSKQAKERRHCTAHTASPSSSASSSTSLLEPQRKHPGKYSGDSCDSALQTPDNIMHMFKPMRKKELLKTEEKQEIVSNVKSEVARTETNQTGLDDSMTLITHLSFQKVIDTGMGSTMKHINKAVSLEYATISVPNPIRQAPLGSDHSVLQESQDVMQSMTFMHKVQVERASQDTIMAEMIRHAPYGIQVSETYNFDRYWKYFIIQKSFKHSIFNHSNSSLMHLILSLSVNEGTCTMEICEDQIEAITLLSLLSDQREQGVDSSPTNEKVKSNLFQFDCNDPMTVLTRLSSTKRNEKVSGMKKITMNQRETFLKTMVFSDQLQIHGESTMNDEVRRPPEILIYKLVTREDELITNNIPIQEEPPDPSSFSNVVLNMGNKFSEELYKVSSLVL